MRKHASLPVRIAVLAACLAGAFACAEGSSTDTGLGASEPKQATEPTEPPPPSITVPATPDDTTPDAAGTSASDASGVEAGPSNVPDAGTTPTPDAGTTPTPDAGTTPTPDAGACTKAPPSNACGVAPQCGCAANQTCDVTNTSTGAVSCVLAGGGPRGSACTTSTQCAKGMTCQFGACRPFCGNPGGTCTGAGLGICYAVANTSGAAVPNLNVCSVQCDPRNPAGACASNTCLWFSADKAADCNTPGTKTQYQACSSLFECAPGLQCAFDPVSLGNACLKWCRLGVSSDCPGLFDSCEDVYGANAPVVGGQTYGLCR